MLNAAKHQAFILDTRMHVVLVTYFLTLTYFWGDLKNIFFFVTIVQPQRLSYYC